MKEKLKQLLRQMDIKNLTMRNNILIALFLIIGLTSTLIINPITSDDVYTSLLNYEINSIQEPKDEKDLSSGLLNCSSCFSKHSYFNRNENTSGLEHSKSTPIVYYRLNDLKIPIFFNLRSSGLPYYLIKTISNYTYPQFGLHVFNFFIFIAIIFAFNRFLKYFFDDSLRLKILAILIFSPIFYLQFAMFLSEKIMIFLLFLGINQYLSEKTHDHTLGAFVFLIGCMIKLTFAPVFLVFYIFLIKRDKGAWHHLLLLLSIFSVVIGMYLLGDNFILEYYERQDEGFFEKTISDWTTALSEAIAIFAHSISSLNFYLRWFGEYETNWKEILSRLTLIDYSYMIISLLGLANVTRRKAWLTTLLICSGSFIFLVFIGRTLGFYSIHIHSLIFGSSILLALGLVRLEKFNWIPKQLTLILLVFHIFKFFNFTYDLNSSGYNYEFENQTIKDSIPFILKNDFQNIVLSQKDSRGAVEFYSREKIIGIYDFNSSENGYWDLSYILSNLNTGTILVNGGNLRNNRFLEQIENAEENFGKTIKLEKSFSINKIVQLQIYTFSKKLER